MDKKDYYEVLGIAKGASTKEIKSAYRKLVKEFHPDHNQSADAEKKFKEVQEAYEVLSDDSKRKAYDQYGHAATDGFNPYANGGNSTNDYEGMGGGAPFDMGDIFSTFFGGGEGGFDSNNFGFDFGLGSNRGRRSKKSVNAAGTDIRYRIKLNFMESMKGGEFQIDITRDIECENCKGTGSENGKLTTCPTCGGQGQVQRVQSTLLGRMSIISECPDCGGTGKKFEKPCKECHGSGVINNKERIKIKLPAGAFDGMVLKFRGGGNSGKAGAPAGDLYVEIQVDPDAKFERRGNDIYTSEEISVTSAVLGDVLDVSTVEGVVVLKIPAGTQSGTIFKLKGKGSPILGRDGTFGDHYVRVDVLIPKKLSRKAKGLWEELKES